MDAATNGERGPVTEREDWPFDDEFGLCMDPCEHPSINGGVCATCGQEVAVGVAHWSPKPFGFRFLWCDGTRCPDPAEHEQALAAGGEGDA
jgi:hypothetical protein